MRCAPPCFVMLVASAFLAGPEKYARLAAAFDWREAAPPGASYRIDAWIDPPAYTGKPPVMLNLADQIPARRRTSRRRSIRR